ncbi:MAG TPA: VOC family protein [Chthoniobacterales bacterium]|jgi:methylmalonyl-CoA/ethylmalonyl-CoA epimerase|nr:VOC family protein [Chthoniobacterales bacterium]
MESCFSRPRDEVEGVATQIGRARQFVSVTELNNTKMDQPILHHIGYVVPSIAAVGARFAKSVAANWDERIIHDPLQKVFVSFFTPAGESTTQIELVEPSAEDSPVVAFLNRGGGLHHLCYEVDNLELHMQLMRADGSVPARSPLPAVAFDGRRIAWMLTPDRLLLEFLERNRTQTVKPSF